MALNANNVAGNKSDYEPLPPGTYPTRLVGIVDLGLQAQRAYQGKEKAPAQEIAVTFEFTDEFMKDEDGNPDPSKPRWITQSFPFHNLQADRAKSTQWYLTLDPAQKYGGDWTKLIGTATLATVVNNIANSGKHKGRVFENIAGIALPRPKDADKYPELVNKPIVFDLDDPDPEVFQRLPKFLQDKIKGNLNYEGSALQKLLGKDTEPTKQESKAAKKEVNEEEDRPY